MKSLKMSALLLIALIALISISACLNKDGAKPEPPKIDNRHDEGIITLFFADKDANFLLIEERTVEGEGEITPKVAFKALIEGPAAKGRFATIPKNTKLLSLEIKDKIAYVNLSHDFKENYLLGSAAETMTIYSIVNTLTGFSDIRAVKFLLEGAPLVIEGSNFDFKVQIFERNEDLIASET